MNVKSIMAIGAATLCSAVFADITSANVVGYKASDLQDGTTRIAPCFVDVGGETDGVDVTKIIPGGSYASGDIVISILDYAGRNIADYGYMVPRRGAPGWANVDTGVALKEGEVVLAPGEGVSITGLDGLSVTSAGQVSTDDRVIALRDGTTPSGNCTAVPLDITSIIPGGSYNSGDIVISILDYAGRNIKDYGFMVPRRGTPGWADVDTGIAVAEGEVVFQPGEGFTVTGFDGLTITIPGPTL